MGTRARRKVQQPTSDRPYVERPSGEIHAREVRAGFGSVLPLATRNFVEWTPETLQSAIVSAEGGSLRLAAEFVDGLLFRDDRVQGALSARTLGLLGLPLQWDGPEPADWCRLAPESALVSILQWGLVLGFGPARVRDDGSLESWDPRHFDYQRTEDQWYVQTNAGREPVHFGTGSWVAFMPYGADMAHMRGLWLALALPALIKHYTLHDRARASEVFGSAMVVAQAGEGTTEAQRKQYLAELRGLARNTRMVLPEGFTIDLLEAQGQTWGIYQQALDWADSAITVAIAGQVVTVEGSKGFSRGDVHERVARSLLRFTAEAFASFIAAQYIAPVWAVDTFPHWVVSAPDELIGEGEGLKALAEGIRAMNDTLADAGESRRVDVLAILSNYRVPTVEVLQTDDAPAVKLELAPTDVARVVRVDEARRSQGLPPIGDDRGRLTIGEMGAPAPDAPDAPDVPTIDAAIASADRLNAASARQCPHGYGSVCKLCGLLHDGEGWGPLGLRRIAARDGSPAVNAGAALIEPAADFRILAYGPNLTTHGPTFLTRENAARIARAFSGKEMMIDLEHLSTDPGAPNYDPDARGGARIECREDGLYAAGVWWTDDGADRIRSRKQGFISPVMFTDRFGVIRRMLNLALTALPAMYYPPNVSGT